MRPSLFFICFWFVSVKGNFILQPKYQSACSGTSAKFTLSDTFKSPKVYQWQRRVGANWVSITDTLLFKGIKNDTLEIPITKDSLNKALFRCIVTVNSGPQYFSDTASLAVLKFSSAASGISGVSTICRGRQTTISVSGGVLGYGASWKWYKNGCSGTSIGSGILIQVNPDTTAFFSVRAEGVCNNTACVDIKITVQDTSKPVSSIAGSTSVCKGKGVTIAANGGSLGAGASWKWYTGSCGASLLGTAPFITVFPAATTTYFLRAEGTCNTTICKQLTVVVQDSSTRASSISGNTIICLGKNNTLSVVGGNLGAGASWKWFSGSCGGTSVGTGPSISVSPATSGSHTYFVRAEGTCNVSPCASITLTVRDTSIPATRITGPAEICYLSNATLSVSGGSLGFGAKWKWYQGNCSGTFLDSGSSIVVSPSLKGTYTYFAKAEGGCNVTVCKSVSIIVRDSSTAPNSITGNTNTCQGVGVNLAVNGGILAAGANWKWYESNCGGVFIGSGNTISVNPAKQTRYFVRAEGICNSTLCKSLLVDVFDSSESPIAINGAASICVGSTTQLTVLGGALGKAASWKWYSGSCGGTFVGAGTSVTVSPSTTTNYFVRAEGLCNSSKCASIKVTILDSSKPADTVFGLQSLCQGQETMLSLRGGQLGASSTWKWYGDACGGLSLGSGESINVLPSKTNQYFVRAEGLCNITTCKKINIVVKDTSILPVSIAGGSSVCVWGNSRLQVNGGKLGTNAKWLWYKDSCGNPNGNVATGTTFQTNKLVKTTTYYVRAEGDCNKTLCMPFVVTVNSKPQLTAIHDTICYGETAVVGAVGAVSYKWMPAAGIQYYSSDRNLISYQNPVTIPTMYKYSIIGTDWNQCSDTIQASVLLNPLPKLKSSTDTGICIGNQVNISVTGALRYIWLTTDGIADINAANNIVKPNKNTSYIIQGVDLNSCFKNDTVHVVVYQLPLADAGSDTIICKNSSIRLNGSGGVVYNWAADASLNQLNVNNPIVKPLQTTKYKLFVKDVNGCGEYDSATVKVIENPTPGIIGKNTVCKNEHAVEFYTAANGNSFTWTIENGEINGGLGTHRVITHWSDKAASGKLTVTESMRLAPYCSTAVEKIITIGGTIAPTPEPLVFKANKLESNIIICPNCFFDTLQWGYEAKADRKEINTCKALVWCKYSQIDTVNNYYWVKIGNDPNCLTKSFLSAPRVAALNGLTANGATEIYPNPAQNWVTIRSVGVLSQIAIFNALGKEIETIIPENNSKELSLDFSSYPRGIYFLKVRNPNGVVMLKLLLTE